MIFDIITIFPRIFDSYFGESIIKRAQETEIININVHNLRDYTTDKHKKVDDTPYGGGAGMVMQIEPIYRAMKALKEDTKYKIQDTKKLQVANEKFQTNSNDKILNDESIDFKTNLNSQSAGWRTTLKTRIILFSAKGKRFTQEDARRLSKYDRLIMVCGRYEGVDERVAEHLVDEELSIGDYVLTGGEIPAMIVVDAVSRLLPGALGNELSAEIESHNKEGYLEYPQYSKPEDFEGWKVPEVLLSGNHGEIEKWRKSKSRIRGISAD